MKADDLRRIAEESVANRRVEEKKEKTRKERALSAKIQSFVKKNTKRWLDTVYGINSNWGMQDAAKDGKNSYELEIVPGYWWGEPWESPARFANDDDDVEKYVRALFENLKKRIIHDNPGVHCTLKFSLRFHPAQESTPDTDWSSGDPATPAWNEAVWTLIVSW